MQCQVNGHPLAPQAITRRGMNFGQHFPGGSGPVPYCLRIPLDEFIRVMGDYYQRYALEEEADDPHHQLGEFPVLDRWKALGYPPLARLAREEPAVLEELVKDWFDQEVLDRFIPGPEEGLPEYLVNTIDRVTVAADGVRLEGQAYPHPALATAVP